MLYVFLAVSLIASVSLTYVSCQFASYSAIWQIPVFFIGSFLALVLLFLLVILVSCLFVDPKKQLDKPSGYFRFLLHEFCRLALVMGGVHVKGYWQRDDMASRTVFYGEDGQEIELQRGKTLIVVADKDNWEISYQ